MTPDPDRDQDLTPLALRLIWDIDGVDKLGEAKTSQELRCQAATED
jgi:hypothetical protein